MESEIINMLDDIIISLSANNVSQPELNENTDLIVDCGFDSISIIECIVEIEQQFNIEFEDDSIDIERIQSYSWLKKYIIYMVKNG